MNNFISSQMPYLQNNLPNEGRSESSRTNASSFMIPLNNLHLGTLLRQYSSPTQNNVISSNTSNYSEDNNGRSQQVSRRISLSALLGPHNEGDHNNSQQSNNLADSVVINLENAPNTNRLQNNHNPTPETGESTENNGEDSSTAETLRLIEAHRSLQIFLKYIPFVLILLLKCLYDNGHDILNFIVLLTTFTHCNSVLKKETAKQSRRNLSKLFLAVIYIIVCLLFIHYVQKNDKLYYYLLLVPPLELPSSVWDLIWTIAMADFILKLITIVFKIILAALPSQIIQFKKRGKYFLFLEAVSQLYRSLVPIQLWLHFLLDFYHGAEKFVGVILSAAYMVSKGPDLMSRLKLFKESLFKLLRNISLGSSPNKDQLQMAGHQCPICHDEYDTPVLLTCKHIFCETCVTTWFDREQTCPLCRAKIVDDPSWRDGSTTFFIQLV
ncbi:RING finger and transmembrane domain-containing protein 2 [Agrilus planipennis]|uniref:RING finger and transmembrane domain-containing protein 2 n=1 Tax=Agrilus planipennis TaxID=224129 RepID=A0A1W4WH37_AGRPL|nr:RING finger and transmembrane domain-containing protein 2 [Agrilus planipennis]